MWWPTSAGFMEEQPVSCAVSRSPTLSWPQSHSCWKGLPSCSSSSSAPALNPPAEHTGYLASSVSAPALQTQVTHDGRPLPWCLLPCGAGGGREGGGGSHGEGIPCLRMNNSCPVSSHFLVWRSGGSCMVGELQSWGRGREGGTGGSPQPLPVPYFPLSSLARQVAASTALMVAARSPPCSRAWSP